MTPKEKAKELVRKYYTWGINKEGQTLSWAESKECALIAIDEVINAIDWHDFETPNKEIEYYQEVKKEIEKYDTNTGNDGPSN